MIELAGSVDRVIPGHDALQTRKYPTEGRITRIKSPASSTQMAAH
jgi:hypothetical protein